MDVEAPYAIVHHQLPIKIVVFNNDGYLSMRHTQEGFLEGRYTGSSVEGGLSFPDILKVAAAYGIPGDRVWNHAELRDKLRAMLAMPGPSICEVMIRRDQRLIPAQGFVKTPDGTNLPRPLEDMAPFLDRKEFRENMFVKPWPSSM